MKKRIISVLLSVYLLAGMAAQGWAQCATCKAAAATTDDSGQLVVGAGLNTAILYLLALPFLTMGILLLLWYLRFRRLKTHS